MGTRADFYIGTGRDAEWLGSVGWDGYEWEEQEDCPLMQAVTEDEFRAAVADIAKDREDWTTPSKGWPWPWDNSRTTDMAYAFQDGKTTAYHWGKGADWPDMTERKNVTIGQRSGLVVFGVYRSCRDDQQSLAICGLESAAQAYRRCSEEVQRLANGYRWD